MSKVNLSIANGKSPGHIAQSLMSNGMIDPGIKKPFFDKHGRQMVTVFKGGDPKKASSYVTMAAPQNNAVLRRDEWKHLDEAVLKISEKRLGGVQDLVAAGLTYDLNGMMSTLLESHTVGDSMEAEASMDGKTRSKGDRSEFSTEYLPLPIIHADYELNQRVLNVSRTLGNPLDTTQAERATRKILEKIESWLFTDTSYTYGGGTIYSYLNHPDVNSVSLGTNWDASAKTAAGIINDVISMKQSSIDAHKYGPWKLYIPTAYETVLDEDYDDTRGNTIRERIEAISGIEEVKVIDTLPANTVVLVQMSSDTVRLVRGLPIQNVQWDSEGGMIHNYKVMTIQVPQVRSDDDGNCGVVVLS